MRRADAPSVTCTMSGVALPATKRTTPFPTRRARASRRRAEDVVALFILITAVAISLNLPELHRLHLFVVPPSRGGAPGLGIQRRAEGPPVERRSSADVEAEAAATSQTAPATTAALQDGRFRLTPPQGRKRRAFVCLTGQLGRLELRNKIETVIRPLQRWGGGEEEARGKGREDSSGFEVDVSLVLTDSSFFTNNETDNGINGAYSTERQVLDQFLPLSGVRVVRPNFTRPHLAHPPVNERYLRTILRKQRKKKMASVEAQTARAANHARIFTNYAACWEDALSSGSMYDLYIRMREDVGLADPLDVGAFNDLPPRTIMSSDCRTWGGMNDRMAIVSPDAAEDYFRLPWKAFQTREGGADDLDTNKFRNPETFLEYIYMRANITVISSSKLRGVHRMHTIPNGTTLFYPPDVRFPKCPKD